MFRESSAIDSERTAASVRSLYAKYAGNDDWFDGTPNSVDRRIAACKKIANAAKAASVRLSGRNVSAQYIALAYEMDSDRTALEGLRRDLLTAAMDREAADVTPTTPPPAPPAPDHSDHLHDGPPMDYGTTSLADHSDHLHVGGYIDPADFKNRGKGGVGLKGEGRHQELSEDDFGHEYSQTRDNGRATNYFGEPTDEWGSRTGEPPQKSPYRGKHRAEARYFIAEQECDDLQELTIRAANFAERISSTLSPKQSAAFVRSFVEAVRTEAARDYNLDHYTEYSHRNGLNPSDQMTADRYSRDHNVPLEVADGYALHHRKSASVRTAATEDFLADLLFLD